MLAVQKHPAIDSTINDLADLGYAEISGPEWLEWAGTRTLFDGALANVAAIVDFEVLRDQPQESEALCQRFEEWSRPLRSGGMATLIVLVDVPTPEVLAQVLQGDRAWYCAHVTRVVHDTNARIYWYWQPATGIQRSQRLPA